MGFIVAEGNTTAEAELLPTRPGTRVTTVSMAGNDRVRDPETDGGVGRRRSQLRRGDRVGSAGGNLRHQRRSGGSARRGR